MQMKSFDFLVFIGRFQPFHLGHLAVIETGLQEAEQLIVLVGSAHQPRSTRNPWSVEEREQMIRGSLSPAENQRLHIAPLMDIAYNDEAWVRNVQSTVNGLVTAHYRMTHKKPRVGLIGHSKDHSSYYLNLFPQWGATEVANFGGLSATPIREAIFGVNAQTRRGGLAYINSEEAATTLPEGVRASLSRFCGSDVYSDLKDEHEFVAAYRQTWNAAPYPPTFVTVDAVVVQSGHVLLVERRARPGKGLFALPGGFVNQGEKLVDACVRELREETRLKVPVPVLKGSTKTQRVYDDPHRSARGRTITHAFYIELEPSSELPKVKGGDDARTAFWLPLSELDPVKMFEDHYFIIQDLLGA